MKPSAFNRDTQLQKLRTHDVWDFLVIGGGASGLGVALEAATRGYSTLLVEQSDFAKGTSSRSTKLVHGGVRYLAQGNVRLVHEAVLERQILHQNAPHLVRDMEFVVPAYSFKDAAMYTVGLKIYDWMAGRKSLGPSKYIGRAATLQKLPGIRTKNLRGGILYHDGQFDDARLALNLAQTAVEQGATVLNYVQLKTLHQDSQELTTATVLDTETFESFEVLAKKVINATGVFADAVMQLSIGAHKPTLRASQGIHLVLPRSFLPGNDALMIPKTSDGRVLFAVPWHNRLVVGTTDTPVNTISLEPKALETEIEFVLETAGAYLTSKPTRIDVTAVFAGLRPLAAPKQGQSSTKEISRSHKIIDNGSNLYSILGGKWTTYRKMGEDMINFVESVSGWERTNSSTESLHIHGYDSEVNWADPLYYYGADLPTLKPDFNNENLIDSEFSIYEILVRHAVRFEMARTVEDFLARRSRVLFLDASKAVAIASRVAEIMGDELKKDPEWVRGQVDNFQELAKGYQINFFPSHS